MRLPSTTTRYNVGAQRLLLENHYIKSSIWRNLQKLQKCIDKYLGHKLCYRIRHLMVQDPRIHGYYPDPNPYPPRSVQEQSHGEFLFAGNGSLALETDPKIWKQIPRKFRISTCVQRSFYLFDFSFRKRAECENTLIPLDWLQRQL